MRLFGGAVVLVRVETEIIILLAVDRRDRDFAQLDGMGEIGRRLDLVVRRIVVDVGIKSGFGTRVLNTQKIVEIAGAGVDDAETEGGPVDDRRRSQYAQIDVWLIVTGEVVNRGKRDAAVVQFLVPNQIAIDINTNSHDTHPFLPALRLPDRLRC